MNKKTKFIVSSAMTMAVCASLIAGSTLALFTSESNVNIAITSGKVDVEASAEITGAWSAEYADGSYQRKSLDATPEGTYTFTTNGTAGLDGDELKLVNIAPGDGVKLKVDITNNSNIAIKYKMSVTPEEDSGLYEGLDIKVSSDEGGVNLYESKWIAVEKSTTIDSIYLEIELPIDATNEYIDKSVILVIGVFAVQGNSAPCDEEGGGHFMGADGTCIFCGKKVVHNSPTSPSNNQEWYNFRDEIKNASDSIFDVTFSEDYASGASGAAANFTVQNNNEVTMNLGDYHFLSSKNNSTSGTPISVKNASLTVNATTPTYTDTNIIYDSKLKSTIGKVNVDNGILKLNGGYYTHYENVAHDSGLIAGLNGSTIEIVDGLFYAKTNKNTGADGAVIYSASGSKVNVAGGFYFGGACGVFRANGGDINIQGNITFGGTGTGSGSAPWFCVENGGEVRILNTVTITYFEKQTSSSYTKHTITSDQLKTELQTRCSEGCVITEEDGYIVIRAE